MAGRAHDNLARLASATHVAALSGVAACVLNRSGAKPDAPDTATTSGVTSGTTTLATVGGGGNPAATMASIGAGGAQGVGGIGAGGISGVGGLGAGGAAMSSSSSSSAGGGVVMNPQVVSAGPKLALAIPDKIYDGTLAKMVCQKLAFSGDGKIKVGQVKLKLGFDHPACGNLVIKVVSPQNKILTVMSRPGYAEQLDDGGAKSQTGYTAGLAAAFPVVFRDAGAVDAETMGHDLTGIMTVCQEGLKECDYKPNPDKGPGKNFTDFNGDDPAGMWQVCVGDSVNGAIGTIDFIELTVSAM